VSEKSTSREDGKESVVRRENEVERERVECRVLPEDYLEGKRGTKDEKGDGQRDPCTA
jgi:hypothetical protein